MSAFIQRDFLASKKPFEIFCNFSRQIEIEYSQKAQNRLYFHEFLALFQIYIFLVKYQMLHKLLSLRRSTCQEQCQQKCHEFFS